MASLSLPRVLQLKKNSLDAEREQFEKFQTLAIQKAINSVETPVKEKHVRSTIIGTFQEQSAVTYWMVAIRLPLQENRIVAWKFCHVTHKLLREGHPACLDDSQRHLGMLDNLGRLWMHLREGYGRLVQLYCALLVSKLRFHARNPRFPGNMSLTGEELDAVAENDVNNYFQLCVELFDYMDDILNLQAAVFDSLGNARANSMTASGQCRLAALIPSAQDSSHIYDCNVRLLFRLHAALPPDTLAGHRERFRQQFKKLSSFYKHASGLQYYRNLLSLPMLPANPPNFLLQSDFGAYVAPVVSVPEPADEPDAVGALVDTTDPTPQPADVFPPLQGAEVTRAPSPQPDPLLERDKLIDHLQHELRRMRSEFSHMASERNATLGSMREHCARLEGELRTAQTHLDEEKTRAELLAAETPEIKQKLTATEEKAKITDEKFQKLKGAYTQLREEHIALIRQKAEVDKAATSLRAAAAEHESAKSALQQQLSDKIKDVELLQQSASSSEEIEAYKSEIANLRSDLEQSRMKETQLETLRASLEALEIEHKTAATESEEKINIVASELRETKESLEAIKVEKLDKESELTKVKDELKGLREKSGDEYKKVVAERDEAVQKVTALTEQYQQEKQVCVKQVASLEEKLNDSETDLKALKCLYEGQILQLNEEMSNAEISSNERIRKEIDRNAEINAEITKQKDQFFEQLRQKDNFISQTKIEFDTKLEELNQTLQEQKRLHDIEISSKEKDLKKLEGRLGYVEAERLTAECELQDLLQQNTDLERNLATAKVQVADLQKEVESARAGVLAAAAGALQAVAARALAALEPDAADAAARAAADAAAAAFAQLAAVEQVAGNEAAAVRSCALATGGAAQLGAIAGDLAARSLDAAAAEALSSQARALLSAAEQCAQRLARGAACPAAGGAAAAARALERAVADADRQLAAGACVDDEMANMDKAIEEAAAKIEEMLRASRAADTGIQLEVNSKILDACTSLMGVVRELVAEARALQQRLGEPAARRRVYRRQPQWSQGLVSAAKAVVFAAKMLVSSADEAITSDGRVEGVCAAAHETAAAAAQLASASRARAPPAAAAALTAAARRAAAAAAALVAAVRAARHHQHELEALDTSSLSLTATRRLEMDSKVRALELECALEAERARLAALRKRHYALAHDDEPSPNGDYSNGNESS